MKILSLTEALTSVRRVDVNDDPDTDVSVDTEIDLDISDDSSEAKDAEADDTDVEIDDLESDPELPNDDFAPTFGSGESAGGGSSGGPDISGSSETGEDQNLSGDDDADLSGVAASASEDPNKQGLIRSVKGAHLVYKRETDNGTFEELWIYSLGTLKDELEVRKAILSGTDIPVNNTKSPDGSQEYQMWSAGNAEMVIVKGLPN